VVEYSKPWLSVDEQVDQLHRRGVHVPDRAAAAALLREVGYYRLTGYLYPFRESIWTERAGRTSVTVLDTYRAGTTFTEAAVLLAFDRQLRLLVIEGVERIEVAIRTHLAHVLGRSSPMRTRRRSPMPSRPVKATVRVLRVLMRSGSTAFGGDSWTRTKPSWPTSARSTTAGCRSGR
jgi:abortive infection bacteriophage resistance protein